MQGQLFSNLEALSDAELVEGLYRVVGSGRRLLAELLAHLCAVEDRRLHLDAGYPSLFAYCMGRLGFSEDEAYRRISVARLARRAPIVFDWIAEGRVSLSVAALLQPYALAPNLVQLIEAVAGKSVKAAREVLVSFFPRPDVASSIRKLPSSRSGPASLAFVGTQVCPPQTSATEPHLAASIDEASIVRTSSAKSASLSPLTSASLSPLTSASLSPLTSASLSPLTSASLSPLTSAAPARRGDSVPRCPPPPASVERSQDRTAPLSPGRFKVQFTADAALKDKLELARDLLRHAVPSGDLAVIVDRALDLLVSDVQKRRFGAKGERKPTRARKRRGLLKASTSPAVSATGDAGTETASSDVTSSTQVRAVTTGLAVHRAVFERDGCRCTWQGPDGVRCNSRAWLEEDHRTPRALGGTTTVENLRLLCRAHNQRAAELVFGRRHVQGAITRSQLRHRARRNSPTME